MRHGKAHWVHEGDCYGPDGAYVGSYFNNESGWFYWAAGNTPLRVASRAAAIAKLEALAAPATPMKGKR